LLFLLREDPLQNHIPALIECSFVFFDIFFGTWYGACTAPGAKYIKKSLSPKELHVDTFLFIRLLNPKIVKIFQKILIFPREFKVWYFHYSSILRSVETKWYHEFAEES